jgi:hypothetical protein
MVSQTNIIRLKLGQRNVLSLSLSMSKRQRLKTVQEYGDFCGINPYFDSSIANGNLHH